MYSSTPAATLSLLLSFHEQFEEYAAQHRFHRLQQALLISRLAELETRRARAVTDGLLAFHTQLSQKILVLHGIIQMYADKSKEMFQLMKWTRINLGLIANETRNLEYSVEESQLLDDLIEYLDPETDDDDDDDNLYEDDVYSTSQMSRSS